MAMDFGTEHGGATPDVARPCDLWIVGVQIEIAGLGEERLDRLKGVGVLRCPEHWIVEARAHVGVECFAVGGSESAELVDRNVVRDRLVDRVEEDAPREWITRVWRAQISSAPSGPDIAVLIRSCNRLCHTGDGAVVEHGVCILDQAEIIRNGRELPSAPVGTVGVVGDSQIPEIGRRLRHSGGIACLANGGQEDGNQ